MTDVLLGASGMLGRAMAAELTRRGRAFIAPARRVVDIAEPESVRGFPWPDPKDLRVINCAGWTDVDGAEEAESRATAVNGKSLGHLLEVVAGEGRLLTFGTDYVFDGTAARPYPTDHPRAPVNAYGRSKAVGEEILESRPSARWLNVRTSWLYAPWGRNFVRTMAELLRRRTEVRVCADQRGRPTSSEHLARASLDLLDAGATGHWHVTDAGECTWFELAEEIRRRIGGSARVVACGSAELGRQAPRPAYSVLDLARTEAALGPPASWKTNLARVLG